MTLVHRRLGEILSGIGPLELMVVADLAMPVPDGVELVDLAVTTNVPGIREVIRAIATELSVEAITMAHETRDRRDALANELAAVFLNSPVNLVTHDELIILAANATVVVRTGEPGPYANIVLHAGGAR